MTCLFYALDKEICGPESTKKTKVQMLINFVLFSVNRLLVFGGQLMSEG